jgi:hypothetical protein
MDGSMAKPRDPANRISLRMPRSDVRVLVPLSTAAGNRVRAQGPSSAVEVHGVRGQSLLGTLRHPVLELLSFSAVAPREAPLVAPLDECQDHDENANSSKKQHDPHDGSVTAVDEPGQR